MGKHAFWTASFQFLAKRLYGVHLISNKNEDLSLTSFSIHFGILQLTTPEIP